VAHMFKVKASYLRNQSQSRASGFWRQGQDQSHYK